MDLVKEARLIEKGRREAFREIEGLLKAARLYCVEELGAERQYRKCDEPADFILWGKLLPAEALGPRCYEHAAKHVDREALRPHSGFALTDLRPFVQALEGGES